MRTQYLVSMEVPRSLTYREREVLLSLLPLGGFPGADAYRRQVAHAEVVAECGCGCASVDLRVDEVAAPRSEYPGTPLLPLEGHGTDPSDSDLPVEVILFAREGLIEMLEIVYYGSQPPGEFPAPIALELVAREDPLDAAS